MLSLLLLTSCGGGKKETIHLDQQHEAEQKAAAQAKVLAEINKKEQQPIDALVRQARFENPATTALEQLLAISQDPNFSPQNQGLAALYYAELLFEFERADAFQVAAETVEQWPEHPYLPHIYLTIAKQWLLLENHEEAIIALTDVLRQPVVGAYTLADDITTAQPLLDHVSQQSKFEWLLAASKHDVQNRDIWLAQAAKATSLEYVLQLRQSNHPLTAEQASFYRYFARERLMVGDYHAVRMVAKVLEMDMPDSPERAIVQHWAESEGERTVIGILLPLTGKYAAYGQQALQGIRLAMSRSEFENSIVLRIQDTAGDANQCVGAYHQLLSQGSQWIIGPLLSSNTQALLPYLTEDIPVIALANQVQLAEDSPALFIHSLAKTIQANFMARQAIKAGKMRTVILHGYTESEYEEAAAFAQTFSNAGGEIIDVVELEEDVFDIRPALITMREATDDEALLAVLEQDLQLFSPEREMDIKMPLSFDNIYVAATGKRVSVLAGQLAYADIRDVSLYGSYRWFDGHLMDDDGRYLSHASFATPTTSVSQPDQTILDVINQYRIVWEQDDINPLFALAYDTAMNIAFLGSRLGLQGQDAIAALITTVEFPAISGNYYFNEYGISQKTFAIQSIRRGHIETEQVNE